MRVAIVRGNQYVIKSDELSTQHELRYIIIDRLTGKVIDDAQGRGYGCQQKAEEVLAKRQDEFREIARRKQAIEDWKRENREIIWILKYFSLELTKGGWCTGLEFNADFVRQCLAINGYYDLPCSIEELMEGL